MKKNARVILCLLLLVSLVCISSCSKTTSTDKLTQEQIDFSDYLDTVFRQSVSSDTLTLNYTILDPSLYDITPPKPTLGDFSVQAMQRSYATEQTYLDELTNFKYEELNSDQQLCYDILKQNFLLDCKYKDYILYNEVLGPTTGIQAQLPILLAEYNMNTKSDVEEYLAILKDIKRYFTQICEFEIIKSKAGLFMSDNVANEIIQQCAAFIDTSETNYLIECFNDKISAMTALSDTEQTMYQEINRDYVLNYVIPAYEELMLTLNNLLGTGTNPLGLAHYTNGKAYYEYLVQSDTGSSRSIPELAQMLEETLADTLLDMASYAQNDSTLVQKLNNYRFVETDPDRILKYLRKSIKKDFPSLPNVNCTIKCVHESLQDYVSPAMYLIPQIDNYSENIIYINSNPDYNMSELFTTIAHEGYPGHLYQNVYFRSKDIHPIRNIFSCLGYEEGWATYAEAYSYCLSGLDSSVAAILRDNLIATHCIYSRTDIGIHYEGWDHDETKRYLSQYVSPESCDIIYKTLLEEPGIYLPYSIGYMEITKMQKEAKAVLGHRFHLKSFHTFLLDLGPADFDTINSRFHSWLKEQR